MDASTQGSNGRASSSHGPTAAAWDCSHDEAFVERFWARVDTSGAGCWRWTAALDDKGYGRVWAVGRVAHAHRIAYALARGPIPAGLFVMHACDNPACVRPDHLSLGTPLDNTRDMIAKGRRRTGDSPAARNAAATHCIHGHPFAGENLIVRKTGGRRCRTCDQAKGRRLRERARLSNGAAA